LDYTDHPAYLIRLPRTLEPVGVLGNQVVFGSVNANSRHFAMGVEDFVKVEEMAPGTLRELLTDRHPWQDFRTWFTRRGTGIKATLEIGGLAGLTAVRMV
jgi:hypothetical protein